MSDEEPQAEPQHDNGDQSLFQGRIIHWEVFNPWGVELDNLPIGKWGYKDETPDP